MTVERTDQPAPNDLAPPTAPVGAVGHLVAPGDCINSIAEAHGFSWRQLWEHPKNAELKRVRSNPNALWPGDRVFVPPLDVKTLPCEINRVHRFRVQGVPARLRMRFLDAGEPRAGERYLLVVDGQPRRGVLDQDGLLNVTISPEAREAVIQFDGDSDPIVVSLGAIRPITSVAGAQARLANLGFRPGPIDDEMGPRTRSALRRFQRSRGIKVTGEPDQTTMNHLLEIHGS